MSKAYKKMINLKSQVRERNFLLSDKGAVRITLAERMEPDGSFRPFEYKINAYRLGLETSTFQIRAHYLRTLDDRLRAVLQTIDNEARLRASDMDIKITKLEHEVRNLKEKKRECEEVRSDINEFLKK